MNDNESLLASPGGFAEEHCRHCAFGWTRQARNGAFTVCLLDRKPVSEELTGCDRYERRDEAGST